MLSKKSSQKDEVRSKILRQNAFGLKVRALILLDITDSEIAEFLLEAGRALDIAMIRSTGSAEEREDALGFDACITDGLSDRIDLVSLVQSSVVPILPVSNAFPKIFSEFDPMKFEGNAFLYASVDKYLIFEKLIRFLENIRYAGDRRTLLENVKKTF